uniref:Uncharacterized protein n=1 Tax=Haptolina ericina TaxID=156174 RepID=A0A7S3AQT0_9EUKA|mmetsp:Transcript_2839/g.6099  ORF Transcript_2839/g.6099 Transcript_2839/m.6099 type:complete len:199 (+) Transcript_2839:20-616(+)
MSWGLPTGRLQSSGISISRSSITPVRNIHAIGVINTDTVVPRHPPVLAPLRSPINPWNSEYGWHEAFRQRATTPSYRPTHYTEVDVHGPKRGDDRAAVWGRSHFALMAQPPSGMPNRSPTPTPARIASHAPLKIELSAREQRVMQLGSRPIPPLTTGVLKNGLVDYSRTEGRRYGNSSVWETSTMAANIQHHGNRALY